MSFGCVVFATAQKLPPRAVRFRPCIDIHDGKVKQIVGSTLRDKSDDDNFNNNNNNFASSSSSFSSLEVTTNFETEKSTASYAEMYKRDDVKGGHAILLTPKDEKTKEVAKEALRAFPGGLQIGGGVTEDTAEGWIEEGASHVIVTSFCFFDGKMDEGRLQALLDRVGRKRLVLDLSCRREEEGKYKVVTDRWQKWTDLVVDGKTLKDLSGKCDEFLVHGVDVEGKKMGLDLELVELLGKYCEIPVTYAGGARSIEDLELVKTHGNGRVDVTIGSALDCFGGSLKYSDVIDWHNKEQQKVLHS